MAFCTNDGARVVDSTLFDIYKQLLNQASEKEDTDKVNIPKSFFVQCPSSRR